MTLQGYKPNPKCPTCKTKLKRDYQSDNVTGHLIKRTLQGLAEKNSEKFSEEQKADLHKKHYAYRDGPKGPLPKGWDRINQDNLQNDPNKPRRKKPKPKSK